MLALLASLTLFVTYGGAAARFMGSSMNMTDLLSVQAGWPIGAFEIELRAEFAGLNYDCAADLYRFRDCVSSTRVSGGLRRELGVHEIGLALDLGYGSATGSATTGFDRGVGVTGSSFSPGAAIDARLPLGSRAELRASFGTALWLFSPILVQYRVDVGIGAAF